ncbi:glycosyltransferase family 2 protein [Lysobacter enzymogenes]|uniref:glycosyltransferase family 2 protein n=1 Tax=Lysobacter enzymogenes TaxID=69 RepID=UPI001AF05EBA|nr:glycosyltransferase family 2 protein [Lysobacter enzymogenes]QQQ02623.1 glycosyltransferase family 2 protein [Lysobacter enzymogenes]
MKIPMLAERARLRKESVSCDSVRLSDDAPATVLLPDGSSGVLKIDAVARVAGCLVISGWKIGDVGLILERGGDELAFTSDPVRRDDVVAHFPGMDAAKLGFACIAETDGDEPVWLCWHSGKEYNRRLLSPVDPSELTEAAMASLGPVRTRLLQRLEVGGTEWRTLLPQDSPNVDAAALGHLESAISIGAEDAAVVCGWAVGLPGVQFWLENGAGEVRSLVDASWRERRDVHETVRGKFGLEALESGFVAYLDGFCAAGGLALKALTESGVHELHRATCVPMPADALAVSRWLFGIDVAEPDLKRHHALIEEPALSVLIERGQLAWPSIPRRLRVLGTPVAEPRVSVIVPLYGRFDFVESQMLEWVRDGWLRANAELIYVIDDPALEAPFHSHAQELFQLYGVAFKWTATVVNRGFSGANNLGAEVASGSHLLFLNSDVFPTAPGWIEPLLSVLESRTDLGAVGPRLVFAEGGIQHAGMSFEHSPEYGVWINRHPYLGLSPDLDPTTELTEVPAVTGACLLIRRRDFDAVGGWDTGYLIGDFEDSDLCLKLRSIGLAVAYLPSVELTHLERQSMTALGGSDYRMRVTLWNAMRHQRRWRHFLDIPAQQGS